jgi:hypothetical protein
VKAKPAITAVPACFDSSVLAENAAEKAVFRCSKAEVRFDKLLK